MAARQLLCFALVLYSALVCSAVSSTSQSCTIKPLGHGKDDTDQVLSAIDKCGKNGRTILLPGEYNITRKMTWNLENSQVDLYGVLTFPPDIQYWLNSSSTYRVVAIQSQASWFVISGHDFTVDAHDQGGINGNGQPWWEYFTTHDREDGDGRPLSLTLYKVQRGVIRNFYIQSPPFWCNAVANSENVLYDGMTCNATNTNPEFFGQNIVPNTDGIDTYRSDSITLKNWDVTCGDDCIAVKGNTSNLVVSNVICRGGNGLAIGSLGQYVDLADNVENVLFEDITLQRINSSIQPNMMSGIYFKTWTDTIHGSPPTGGGGGKGIVKNVVSRRFVLHEVTLPVHLYQTNGGSSTDVPSFLQLSDLSFEDWSGTASTNEHVPFISRLTSNIIVATLDDTMVQTYLYLVVDLACSTNAPCPNISFSNFNVALPAGTEAEYICQNVVSISGLQAPCNATGKA